MKILFIGDIFGSAGKQAIQKELKNLRKNYQIDFVIANAENCTKGRGLNWKDYDFLVNQKIDFITMGNHTWHKSDIFEILKVKNNIIRPNNLKSELEEAKVGVGTKVVKIKNKSFRITNLLGMSVIVKEMQTNPFIDLEEILKTTPKTDFHIVDFHCEYTSEKIAFFLNFQNRVDAILCTHTHVQTNDDRIVNKTAYITDVGMTGALNGIIGAKPDSILNMFRGNSPYFKLEEQIGPYQFCAVILSFDETKKEVVKIEKVRIEQNDFQ
ncbi:MAG: TIGR00282 family metallophosphoesterase [Malacoplasma sp.]|nr:TIGR00282 family metallophosphoesterase [Malacoplasma sp.]